MKKLTVGILATLLVCAPMAFADDAKPTKPVTTEVAKPADAKPVDAKAEPVKETAPEPDVDVVDENPAEFISNLVEAVHSKNWTLAIGMILMLLVWIVRKFVWKAIPAKAIPYVSAALALVATLAIDLFGPEFIWWKALLSALTSSAGAVFLWESLFKHVTVKKA